MMENEKILWNKNPTKSKQKSYKFWANKKSEATKMIQKMIHGIKKNGRNENDTIQEKNFFAKGVIMSAHFSGQGLYIKSTTFFLQKNVVALGSSFSELRRSWELIFWQRADLGKYCSKPGYFLKIFCEFRNIGSQ